MSRYNASNSPSPNLSKSSWVNPVFILASKVFSYIFVI
jgi:hypothetical protein